MDGHATTRVDPRVIEAMVPFFEEHFGNASSRHHRFGWTARDAVAAARADVAALVGSSARELVFTSGATESNNLAIKGVADAERSAGNHVVTVETEHRAVLDPCAALERQGLRVTYLPVRDDGLLEMDTLVSALTPETILVSVMAANNEIGVLHPVGELARVARAAGARFHTDAAQAVGRIHIDVSADPIDLVSLTAHKLHGPKGIGALFVRDGLELTPLVEGGGHETGLRSGTLNVPAIVGFGKAARIGLDGMAEESARLAALRDRLADGLRGALDGVPVNGSMEARLPHNLNVSFEGVSGQQLLTGLTDVAVSSGAACTTTSSGPSHVLQALGLSSTLSKASLRFGLGRFNTADEVDRVVELVRTLVIRLRAPVEVFDLADEPLPPGWSD